MPPRTRSNQLSAEGKPKKEKTPAKLTNKEKLPAKVPEKVSPAKSKKEDSDIDLESEEEKEVDLTTDLTSKPMLVSKGSGGIGPKSLPAIEYKLKSADDYEDWRRALEAYGLANNSWQLIFLPHTESLKYLVNKYSSLRTVQDITLAHDEWCGKLFGVMYQSVMKLTGDVLLGELRELQSTRAVDTLADPNHLLTHISDRYENLSCFSKANDFVKAFAMVYDVNQNPAELRERLLSKILRFEGGETNVISERMKMTIIYNTIPSSVQPLIRGYVPNKAKITFDDVYNALKVMYDERKSKTKRNSDIVEISKKERKVLALWRQQNNGKHEQNVLCWYCGDKTHRRTHCPKLRKDKQAGLDTSVNPFKPKDSGYNAKPTKHALALKSALKRKQEAETDSEDETPTQKVRFNMCIINLQSLSQEEDSVGHINQVIISRTISTRTLHLDSGAFMHITCDRTILVNIRRLKEPIPLTGAFGQSITYVKEVGDIVLNMGVKFREVGIVPNAHMTLISEARIQEAGYGINKPPGKAVAQIYQEQFDRNRPVKKTIMEFTKDRATDMWTFNMADADEPPQERYLEKSGMVRFRTKSTPPVEEEKSPEEAESQAAPQAQSSRRIQKKGEVQQKGGRINLAQISAALEESLPKNKRKRS